jgi:hypothetical protein
VPGTSRTARSATLVMSTRNGRRSPCSISDPGPPPRTAWRRQRTPFLRNRHILPRAAGLPARGRGGSSSESACGLLPGARGILILRGNSLFCFWRCAVHGDLVLRGVCFRRVYGSVAGRRALFLPGFWEPACVATVDSRGRTIFVADAHRGDGKRFVVHADEKLTALIELESAIQAVTS